MTALLCKIKCQIISTDHFNMPPKCLLPTAPVRTNKSLTSQNGLSFPLKKQSDTFNRICHKILHELIETSPVVRSNFRPVQQRGWAALSTRHEPVTQGMPKDSVAHSWGDCLSIQSCLLITPSLFSFQGQRNLSKSPSSLTLKWKYAVLNQGLSLRRQRFSDETTSDRICSCGSVLFLALCSKDSNWDVICLRGGWHLLAL